jgi:hypothetical protein
MWGLDLVTVEMDVGIRSREQNNSLQWFMFNSTYQTSGQVIHFINTPEQKVFIGIVLEKERRAFR